MLPRANRNLFTAFLSFLVSQLTKQTRFTVDEVLVFTTNSSSKGKKQLGNNENLEMLKFGNLYKKKKNVNGLNGGSVPEIIVYERRSAPNGIRGGAS